MPEEATAYMLPDHLRQYVAEINQALLQLAAKRDGALEAFARQEKLKGHYGLNQTGDALLSMGSEPEGGPPVDPPAPPFPPDTK
jgi:hypothetical protein